MNLTHTTQGNALVATLPERLIKANASSVREDLKTLIDQGNSRLVLDMSATKFADSSGLSVLISALKHAQESNGEVVLLSPTRPILSLLELTRLHHVFQIFEDVNVATAAS